MKMKFADCVLDLSARQLERQGRVVSLEPKVYELLEALIKRRPAVVTNRELDDLLWPQVYVARTSLTQLISKLRTALGDTPHESNIIRTAYKTGYAFCAPATCAPSTTIYSTRFELFWKRHSLPLTDGVHLAGRDEACALVIDADTVSRHHARITIDSGAATIEDLGSTNGTEVNGMRICAGTQLRHGDEIRFGSEQLQFRRRVSALTVKVDDNMGTRGKTQMSEDPSIR
jgi:DNA-binding winged helix-turn-helix (wHTH) protein